MKSFVFLFLFISNFARAQETLAPTPPMGWNSWNVWGDQVDENKIRQAADFLIVTGLAEAGYRYVNIDDGWMAERNERGEIQPNSKFRDMKALANYIHSKGLKLGIYSSPGYRTCGGHMGSFGHEYQDAQTFADWGIDYIKYDWCTSHSKDLRNPYALMAKAIKVTGRPMVLSICQYGWGEVYKWGRQAGGQLWRTTEDITDTWESVSKIGFSQSDLAPYAGPGGWNDPDMLVVGWLGWGESLRSTRLTHDEQLSHVSLWSLLGAPLIMGMDLTKLDQWTLDLLRNKHMIAINQDSLGVVGKRVKQYENQIEAWARPLEKGSFAIAIFNRSESEQEFIFNHRDFSMLSYRLYLVYDIWNHGNLGVSLRKIKMKIPSHGVRYLKLISFQKE